MQEHFGKWSLYRWHIEDPIRFSKSIKVTIEHGHANDQGNEYSSVGYWYQLGEHKPTEEYVGTVCASESYFIYERLVSRLTSFTGILI